MSYDVKSNPDQYVLPKISKFGQKKSLPWIEYRYTLTPSTGDTSISASGELKYQVKLSKTTFKCVYGPASFHSSLITLTGTGYFDSCANSCIDRVTEIAQDTISDFRHSNVYTNLVLDFVVGKQERKSFWNFFGCAGDNVAYNVAEVGGSPAASTVANLRTWLASNANLATQLTILIPSGVGPTIPANGANILADIIWAAINEVNSGANGNNKCLGDYLTTGGFGYYSQVIPGSVIGAMQQKLFPVSECNQGYELAFYLDTYANAFSGAPTAFTMNKNRLHLCVIEFNEALSTLMRNTFQNIFNIPTVGIQNYTTQFTNTADGTQFTWQVPVALSNAQGIIFTFRPATNFVAGAWTLSQRAKLGCSQYQLQIGNRVLPSNRFVTLDNKAVSGGADAEGFMETCKYFNNTIANNACVGSVNYKSFNRNISDAAEDLTTTSYPGHFAIGFNLQGLFDSQDNEFRSCTQLESNTTFLNVTFTKGLTADETIYVDAYVQYEMDLIIADGNLTTLNKLSAYSSGIPG